MICDIKSLRKVYLYNFKRIGNHKVKDTKCQGTQFYGYVQLYDQDANDFLRVLLENGEPCMVSKFGTIELSALVAYFIYSNGGI